MPYILLIIGLVLTWLEFYLPGGIFAVAAALFVLAAQVSIWSTTQSVVTTFFFFIATVVATIAVIYFAIKRIKQSGERNTFYLSKDQEGYKAADFSEKLIGKKGVTLTEFGPSGYVLIEGVRYGAVCRGPYLDKGRNVVVIAGECGYLVVKPLN